MPAGPPKSNSVMSPWPAETGWPVELLENDVPSTVIDCTEPSPVTTGHSMCCRSTVPPVSVSVEAPVHIDAHVVVCGYRYSSGRRWRSLSRTPVPLS